MKKLNEFYYPLKKYLDTSKSFSEILKSDKPKGFRTLLHLLNPDIEYEEVGKIMLTKNDQAIINQIIKIGFEIEKLITEKSGIIDDIEFTKPYKPSPEFSDVIISNEMSILTLAVNHIRIIRLAFENGIKSDVQKYVSYVYPRELNQKVEIIIQKLEREIKLFDSEIIKLLEA